jgi:hypothetical protein
LRSEVTRARAAQDQPEYFIVTADRIIAERGKNIPSAIQDLALDKPPEFQPDEIYGH